MKRIVFFILLLFSFFYAVAQNFSWNEKWTERNWDSKEEDTSKTDKKTQIELKWIDMSILPKGEYVIGEDVQSFTAKRVVNEFAINKYETTYSVWFKIKSEAEKLGYIFQNPGQEGSEGRRGAEPTTADDAQPVTMISWYDAIVWCNALSELKNLSPCYTYKDIPVRDSSNTAMCDLATCNFFSTGYRLPTEAEWEYAARYSKKGLQTGNHVSGDTNSVDFDTPQDDIDDYAWTYSNAYSTKAVGTAGTIFDSSSQVVSGTGNANKAGLFDMSGNVLEFCWDWYADYSNQNEWELAIGPKYGSQRVSRGGSWSEYTMFYYAGDRYSFDPNECYDYMGFRIAQSR